MKKHIRTRLPLTEILTDFHNSFLFVYRFDHAERHYTSMNCAQTVIANAVKRLGYKMKVVTSHGAVIVIKDY